MISKTEDGYYRNRGVLSRLVIEDRGDDSILPMLLHMAHVWKSWSDLTEIVRGGEILYGAGNHTWSEEIEAFIGAMDVIALKMADTVVADLADLTQFQRLLDLGGGPGTYTAAFLSRYPRMTATLFDRPQVVDLARKRLKEKGLINRVRDPRRRFQCDCPPQRSRSGLGFSHNPQ